MAQSQKSAPKSKADDLSAEEQNWMNEPDKPGYDPTLPQNTPKAGARPTSPDETVALEVDDKEK
jgi:hypothetical protein